MTIETLIRALRKHPLEAEVNFWDADNNLLYLAEIVDDFEDTPALEAGEVHVNFIDA